MNYLQVVQVFVRFPDREFKSPCHDAFLGVQQFEKPANFLIRDRWVVADMLDPRWFWQYLLQVPIPPCRVLAIAIAMYCGPRKYPFDALPEPGSCFCLYGPYWLQNL